MRTQHVAAISRRIVNWKGGYRTSRALINRHLRKRRLPIEHDVLGFRMMLDPHEYVDQNLLFYPQIYEAAELEYVRTHLKPGDTFADIGANIGLYSLLACGNVGPSGKVVAVEADPDTFRRLDENLKLNSVANVRAYNHGMSDSRGSLPLYRWAEDVANAGANTLVPTPDAKWTRAGEVECMPLLDVLNLARVERVDGLKIDIERAEYKVLKRFFADAPVSLLPSFILFEEYEATIELAGGSALDLLQHDGRYRRVSTPDALSRDHVFERAL